LRPGTAPPELKIEFFAFANVNNTIRLREGRLLVRLSDLLEGAPDGVVRAMRTFCWPRCTASPSIVATRPRYRKYIGSHEVVNKAHLVRQMRGRKQLHSPQGRYYDLDMIFEDLNRQFFHGLLGRPRMSWSRRRRGGFWGITIRRTMRSSSAGF